MKDPKFADKLANDFSLRLEIDEQRRRLTRSFEPTSVWHPMAPESSSTATLAGFKKLRSSTTLLLFTPVTRPIGYQDFACQDSKPILHESKASNVSAMVDPFEMLGRAISKIHRRVRHVPYVPSIGFTETHALFLKEADAVIIVTCMPAEPSDAGAVSASGSASVSIFNQTEFAGSAIDALDDTDLPLVNLYFGNKGQRDRAAMAATHDLIWVSDKYDSSAVQAAVGMMFEGSKQ